MLTHGAGMAQYLKRAFLYRWNLLLFLSGAAAAALSPWPDALLPLLLAAELAYLGGLVSRPKFRDAIDAQVYKETQQSATRQSVGAGGESLLEIVNALPPKSRERFEALRRRCLEMKSIARGVGSQSPSSSEDLSTPALDRLLWIFLRLLVSQEGLDRFLRSTSDGEIRSRIEEVKAKLNSAAAQEERFKHSLEDSVAAQELRLQNYKKAGDNAEFVRVELDRIEAKIQALVESSVNRQDPNMLSSQIEGVTQSVQSTEAAIRELQQITGVVDQLQEPPAILDADWGKVAH
jgi:chemotaxis protein histidine kinase CheA